MATIARYIAEPERPPFCSRVTYDASYDAHFRYYEWRESWISIQGREARGWHYTCCAAAKLRRDGELGRVRTSYGSADQAYSELHHAHRAWVQTGRPSEFCLEDGVRVVDPAA